MKKKRKPGRTSVPSKKSKGGKNRVETIRSSPSVILKSEKEFEKLIGILGDRTEDVEVRLAALQSLQAASFSVIVFEPCLGDYVATLRAIADDPDGEIRQRALGILARKKDGFAQRKLLEGLSNPATALVPPEKALQLLGYDPHAEAYPVARAIVSQPPNDTARREALRLLSADATSAPLFEKILTDKNENPEVRQISASALHSMQPRKLQSFARTIMMDPTEHEEIQATCLTALAQFGDGAAIAKDQALLEGIGKLSGKHSPAFKKNARDLLTRYGVSPDTLPA